MRARYCYFGLLFFFEFLIGINLPILRAQHKSIFSTGIDKDTLNVVLLIDRSGSMAGDNKIENARLAAKSFVGFMRVGDAIGVVSFNDTAHTEFALQTIESDTTKLIAQVTIDSIIADGSTSIGDGIRLGQAELNKGNPGYYQAMLLLSDGKENIPPFAPDILPEIPDATDIYVVGLGWNADGALLSQIAASTGGIYIFIQSATELQRIFTLLRGFITGQQTLSNFTGSILQGGIQVHPVTIDALSSFASFFLTFPRGDIDLELVTPGGDIINPLAANSDTNIIHAEGAGFEFYAVKSPEPGQWNLKILGINVPYSTFYSAVVQASSGIKMEMFLDKSFYRAGEPILVTAYLHENALPILNAYVTLGVSFPLDSTFTLFDDGLHDDGRANDGIYCSYFTNTLRDGNYTFTMYATGRALQGGAFMRENMVSTFVNPSTAPAVVSVFPDSGRLGETLTLTIKGGNFTEGTLVSFNGASIAVTSVSVISVYEIIAKIYITPGAAAGFQGITVTNPDGQQGLGPGLFYVLPVPAHFELMQNYPNPFNMTTNISYHLPKMANVQLKIYNMLGQQVRTLVDSDQQAGFKTVTWDALDDEGRPMASGVYFYQLMTQNFKMIKKLLLLR